MRDLGHTAWVNSRRCYTPHASTKRVFFFLSLKLSPTSMSTLVSELNYNILHPPWW